MIYNPLIPFENYNQSNEKFRKNNAFSTYDSKFNFIKTTSSYSNRYQYLAVNSKHNGNVVSDRTTSQYDCVGSLGSNGKYVQYECIAKVAGKADLNLILSSSNKKAGGSPNNYLTPDLSKKVSLTINNVNYDLSGIPLRSNDVNQWYEWEQLCIRDVDMNEGTNTIRIEVIGGSGPNHLMLDVYSDVYFV